MLRSPVAPFTTFQLQTRPALDTAMHMPKLPREILGFIGAGLYLAAGIAFIAWFHRAHSNLEHFGHERAHGTGWAIGAWFVPIISLFRPYQMACEIWRASDPEPRAEFDSFSNPPLLRAWWALWIIGLIVGQIAFRFSLEADAVDSLRASTAIQMIADVLDFLAAPVAIIVVRELTRRQEARCGDGHGRPRDRQSL